MAGNTNSIRSPTENSEAQARPGIPKVDKKRKAPPPVGETSVDDSTEDPGKRKPSRPRSWTWDHFTRDPNSKSSTPRAKCNWCGASYACDTHRNGTTNMKNHLLTQCKKFPKESLDPSQTILSFQQLKKEEGKGIGSALHAMSFDADACRQALARMVIVDELPFKFVEGEGFRYFMSVVHPNFLFLEGSQLLGIAGIFI